MNAAQQAACAVRIGRDYPLPVVDHAVQRARALEMYKAVRAAAG
jgi:deoxyribodipyrimidine photo-lyase